MKNLALIAVLSFAVVGCTAQQAADKIKEVQAYTALACSFIPTVAVVASLFKTTLGDNISAVGGAICNAVTVNPLAEGPGKRYRFGQVNGVVIKGIKLP